MDGWVRWSTLTIWALIWDRFLAFLRACDRIINRLRYGTQSARRPVTERSDDLSAQVRTHFDQSGIWYAVARLSVISPQSNEGKFGDRR